MKTETLGWTQKSNKFSFIGRPVNDPMQKVKYHFSDGDYLIATKAAHSVNDLQKITVSNGGKGADLTIDKGNIIPSDGVNMVTGAVETLDSEECGDSGRNLNV